MNIEVNSQTQTLQVLHNGVLLKTYAVSTGKNGMGEQNGSEQTPRGKHIIRAKIGAGEPLNTVFVGRRPTGEIFNDALFKQFPGRDWILTRIFWLSGTEVGKNRLGNVDTMRRYIYIHGTPDRTELGKPGSRGCIRMANADLLELFDMVPVLTKIEIF